MIPYCLKKLVFRFLGDIRWTGWKCPLWVVWGPETFRLKGKHYRAVERIIKPGDILIRRFEGYVDKWLIPGWWNHAGIYVGTIEERQERIHRVVHAVSEGVIEEDLIDFCRTDHLIVLRGHDSWRWVAIERAKFMAGKSEYDFGFDFVDPKRLSCTELAAKCFPALIVGKRRFGRFTIVADDFVNSPQLETVWDSRKAVV